MAWIWHSTKISGAQLELRFLNVVKVGFLFFKATSEEVVNVKSILNDYSEKSGQAINLQKSGIFFSSNVRRDKQLQLLDALGVHDDIVSSNYLGLPSLISRSKKWVFGFLKDRVKKRIQSWSVKTISRAGKTVLIRNVARSIHAYCMTCFLLPKTLCQEIERFLIVTGGSQVVNRERGSLGIHGTQLVCRRTKEGLSLEVYIGSI